MAEDARAEARRHTQSAVRGSPSLLPHTQTSILPTCHSERSDSAFKDNKDRACSQETDGLMAVIRVVVGPLHAHALREIRVENEVQMERSLWGQTRTQEGSLKQRGIVRWVLKAA